MVATVARHRLPQRRAFNHQAWVLPLHSMLGAEAQLKVFQTPPPGLTKVVLATNIAETSITIDDVSFVIDCGRHKENRYEPRRKMEMLVEDYASQANLKQRRGRAGRAARRVGRRRGRPAVPTPRRGPGPRPAATRRTRGSVEDHVWCASETNIT